MSPANLPLRSNLLPLRRQPPGARPFFSLPPRPNSFGHRTASLLFDLAAGLGSIGSHLIRVRAVHAATRAGPAAPAI